ncbi:UNVERIFIED_CONTAM: hypothetical protein Scaly_2252000 [Sesamum calycinum]|uniref:MULE transposase domain-containing protein n=1 Tax=Sesamum calycinum TaxID=2727403 RepID=A0AAW2MBF2_9LAMI
MALMPIIRPASLVSEGVPDYGVGNVDFEDDEDKGKSVVIEESGDGERADWIDWDRDDEDMRENEEWVADSEDDLEYNHVHNCGASFNVKNVRINWLSQRYVEAFRSDPNRSVKGFRQDVIRQLRCNVSRGQAYKTKRRCLQEIQGDGAEQYSRMWDYAGALRNKNPGSTIIMNLEDADATGKKKFKRFYVCFAAVKKGFLSGCRPFIGVDGCHLKGPHGGVLLTAVGVGYKKALWFAAKTTTVSQFQKAMQDIADLDLYPRGKREAYSDNVGVDKGTLSARYMHQQSCLLMDLWEKAGYIPPVPPIFGRKRERPARARRLEPDDVRKGKKPGKEIQKMPRQRGKMRCKFCHQVGHTTQKDASGRNLLTNSQLMMSLSWLQKLNNMKAPIQQDEVIVNEDCPQLVNLKKLVHLKLMFLYFAVNVVADFILLLMLLLMLVADFAVNVHFAVNVVLIFLILNLNMTGPTVPYPNGDIIIQDGKKYVTLSNLRSVMTSQNAQPKDKGKRKM